MDTFRSQHLIATAEHVRGSTRTALLTAVSALAWALSATPAAAQVVYTDQRAFLAALASSQTYSGGAYCPGPACPGNPPISAYPIQLPAIGPLAVASGAVWVHLPTDQVFNYGGGPVFGFNIDAPSGDAPFVTLVSPTPIYAFGVNFGEPTRSAPFIQSTFTFTLGSGFTFGRQAQGSGEPVAGPPPLAFEFFGVISPTPFSEFTINVGHPEGLGPLNSVAFNNVTVGVVPEPCTMALLGVGLAALGIALRRRSRTNDQRSV